jgi:hypothetical protein
MDQGSNGELLPFVAGVAMVCKCRAIRTGSSTCNRMSAAARLLPTGGAEGARIRQFDTFMMPICADEHQTLMAIDFMGGCLCIHDSIDREFRQFGEAIKELVGLEGGEALRPSPGRP